MVTRNTKTEIRANIQIGYRIGKLTVVAPTAQRKSGYTVWHCQCDCGGEIFLDTRCLQRGTVRDCGCETVVKPGQRDITGQRFGKLTALYPTEKRGSGGSMIWHCKCDCGGEVDAPLHQLTAGYRKSCGCLGNPPVKDIIGKQFGDLTVTAYDGNREGTYFWRCRCKCGRETVVRQYNLLLGHTKSCGCLQKEQIRNNLRLVDGTSVTLLEAAKTHVIASNSSGYSGVYWNKKSQKWAAQITFKRKTYYLGLYGKIEDAVKARRLGEEMHNDFLQWYYYTYPTSRKSAPEKNNRT